MTMTLADESALHSLDARLRAILPEPYQDTYEDIQPTPMGSAGLKFGVDGQVAWHEMWGSFCDLAMAGGPPHKGTFLEPASEGAIAAEPERYRTVVDEICRGIRLVTDLPVYPAGPGWVSIGCHTEGMAEWLVRAIVMENVAATRDGSVIELPAGPAFRLDKEIKNVITVAAKTCHYWTGHMSRAQQRAASNLFLTLDAEAPLLVPGHPDDPATHSDVAARAAAAIRRDTGLEPSPVGYTGWLGLECSNVRAAVWMMRAAVVSNVLARRERTSLFVPINPRQDPDGARAAHVVGRVHRLARIKSLL